MSPDTAMSPNALLPDADRFLFDAARRRWGEKLLVADLAIDLAEAMVAWALPPAWRRRRHWLEGGFFENVDGTVLETIVCTTLDHHGRTARRGVSWQQTTRAEATSSRCKTKGDIYVLAHHPIADPATADHRDPSQWRFWSVLADDCPNDPDLRLDDIHHITTDAGLGDLADAVAWTMMIRTQRMPSSHAPSLRRPSLDTGTAAIAPPLRPRAATA